MLTQILNPLAVETRNFLTFTYPCALQLEDKSGLNEWIERMVLLHEDLKWLLSVAVPVFWNQVLFDPTWSTSLDSFLSNCPRAHDLRNIPETCKNALSRVSKLFLFAIKRMTMHKESDEFYLTEDEHGEIIYENYLFDAAKLLDMCAIYNRSNNRNSVITEILQDVFRNQPNYYDDLSNSLASMTSTVNTLQDKLQLSRSIASKGSAVNGREAQDMLLFIYDMVMTFNAFLNIFPHGAKVFFKTELIGRLSSLCESIIPDILKLIEVNRKKYKYMTNEIQHCVAKFVNLIIQNAFINYMEDSSMDVNVEELSVEYVNTIDTISQYPTFLSLYCAEGSVLNDLKKVEANGCMDISSVEYLRNMLSCVVSEFDSDQVLHQLREFLPMKGEQFLQKCIDRYGNNVDVIVNNVMEGNISEDEKPQPEKKIIILPDKEILDDNKEHVALLKASIFPPTLHSDEDDYYNGANVYDDEYDDTYDSQNVAAQDADSADEFMSRKFTIPDALRRLGDASESSEEEEKNETKEGDINRNQNNQTADNRRGRGRGRGGRGGPRGNGSRDRGRGQNANRGGGRNNRNNGRDNRGRGGGAGNERNNDENGPNNNENVRGDENNDKNAAPRGRGRGRGRGKGWRGNSHNRRVMADKKKSKGMMPF